MNIGQNTLSQVIYQQIIYLIKGSTPKVPEQQQAITSGIRQNEKA